tara:strand:+ start:2901 stop:3542 length:642 start_codon:yes stop_codon:yes gene_type:complete
MIIHQVFWNFHINGGKELVEIDVFRENTDETKRFCEEYGLTYKMWGLRECEELICDKYPEYLCLWEEFRFPIQKCDFIRYLILYEYGGWYVDCDVHPIKDLSVWRDYTECFACWSDDKSRKPYNAVMYSQAKNPLMKTIMNECEKKTVEKQSMKIYEKWKGRLVFQTTGHFMLNKVVPKSSLYEIMMIDNPKKGISVCADIPYFYDQNVSFWF